MVAKETAAGEPADRAFDAARSAMVDRQLRDRGIADERVLASMAAIPRERFVRTEDRRDAYIDAAVAIGGGQTISQPWVVARMTELLELRPGDRVLEVGTGSGYQTAILAWLGAVVRSYERRPELAAAARVRLDELGLGGAVEIRVGDGSLGDPDGAPWDRIVIAAASPRIPDELRTQLVDGGRLVVPVGPRWRQELTLVVRDGDRWTERKAGACVFVPLVGAGGFAPDR